MVSDSNHQMGWVGVYGERNGWSASSEELGMELLGQAYVVEVLIIVRLVHLRAPRYLPTEMLSMGRVVLR